MDEDNLIIILYFQYNKNEIVMMSKQRVVDHYEGEMAR